MSRYLRQTVLPQIGADGQERIATAHVLVVGAGGLGVPVLQYLAGAGIGAITLIDPDRVEESNLHRQPAYRQHPVGPGGLAVTEAKAERVISLPMSAYLDEAVQDRVIAAVAGFG